MILCKAEHAKVVDSAVFPGIQGGPLMHVVAAKAVSLKDAMSPEFGVYQAQIIANAKHLARRLEERGYRLVSGGTDTHLFLIDLSVKGITGKDAQEALEESGIMVNKNLIPFDGRSPNITSGIRIGTPAVTTRGMKEPEMDFICDLMDRVLKNLEDGRVRLEVKDEVRVLCGRFPFYAGIYQL
jgi:glycine hydroxymethyltransferase